MPAPRQGSAQWLELRRSLVTSTDLPIILGISPYRSEGELAREKLGQAEPQEATLQMRVGLAVEPLIKDEYERQTGRRLHRFHGLVVHPDLAWAAASPDWRVVGERRLVEGKWTQARRWDDADLPQDVEAQVRWAMGCAGYPAVDVAAVVHGRDFRIVSVDHDTKAFADLVVIAEDFRARLAAGGPFSETKQSLRALYPLDDGTTVSADEAVVAWMGALLALRAQRAQDEQREDELEIRIKDHMATATRMTGPGWTVSWKRSKDSTEVNWRGIAEGLLTTLTTEERDTLLGLHSAVRPGARPFRITMEKDQ